MVTSSSPGKSSWKFKAVLFLATLLIATLIVYRLGGTSFQWGLFLSTLSHIHWGWLTICILLTLMTYWGRALRWEVMLRPLGRTLGLRKLTYDTAIGFAAVALLGRAGEVVRPYLIAVSASLPFSSQVAAWMLERILDLLAVLLLFGFAMVLLPSRTLVLGPALRWAVGTGGYLIGGIGIACLLFLVLFRNFSAAAQQRILSAVTFLPESSYKRVENMLRAFSQGMESTRDSKSLALLLAYTGFEWVLIIGSYYTLFQALPVTSLFKITDAILFLGFLAFGSLVQIPGIGGGVQVVSVLVLTEIYRIPVAAAAGVAVFIWLMTFVIIVPVGLACAFHEGLNWSKIKQLPKNVTL